MNRAIEKDLFILLPTLTSTGLPLELVQLANSLLAQSRSKANSLKPDEEIARSFCCAHIASERLKIKLDLPDIQVRPPCSKNVYNKLFRFLNSVLAQKTNSRSESTVITPSATPSKRKRLDEGQGTPSRVVIREKDRSVTSTPSRPTRQQETISTPSKALDVSPSKPSSRAQIPKSPVSNHIQSHEEQEQLTDEVEVDLIPHIDESLNRIRLNSGKLRGGEMLNCAIDWLSDERRQEYKIWKANMMRIINKKLKE